MDLFRQFHQALTARQFQVGELYYGLDFTQTEIARRLGVRRQTVGRILMQARRRLVKNCLPGLQRIEGRE